MTKRKGIGKFMNVVRDWEFLKCVSSKGEGNFKINIRLAFLIKNGITYYKRLSERLILNYNNF